MSTRSIEVGTFKSWLLDGQELAVIDVRDRREYDKGAPLFVPNAPASDVLTAIDRLVPRLSVRTVLVDAGDGVAKSLVEQLVGKGRVQVVALAGGIPAWTARGVQGLPTFDTPGAIFTDNVRASSKTPVITAVELAGLRHEGKDVVVLDSRTVREFEETHVPGAISVPGAELVYRYADIVSSPETLVVVSCAGLARGIIGAQTLIDAGVPNKVAYLHNGTKGWRDAGLDLEHGLSALYKPISREGRRVAESLVPNLAQKDQFKRIDVATATGWRGDKERTTFVLDVRTPEEFAQNHLPGSISAEGGQLVAASFQVIGVRGARVVLIDDLSGVRAATTAHWLSQRGFEVAFLLHDFAKARLEAVA